MKGKISKDPIVISGISGRFPESWNVEEFWSNLLSGQVLCSDTEERWPKGMSFSVIFFSLQLYLPKYILSKYVYFPLYQDIINFLPEREKFPV